MKTEEIMFILTFVFGVIRLITEIMGTKFSTITGIIITEKLLNKFYKGDTLLAQLLYIICKPIDYLGQLFTYFALCYQVWFWYELISHWKK